MDLNVDMVLSDEINVNSFLDQINDPVLYVSLCSLKELQQKVLMLRIVYVKSFDDIGGILNMTAKQAENSYYNAIRKIRKQMSNDLAGEYLIEIFKTIRAYGGSAICATQDLADCFAVRDGKLGRGILSNSKTKIVLNMEVSEAERIQEELDLSEAETNSIIHFERGNGLISTNNNNLIVEFKASALEKDLITTDRKDLQELKDRIRKYGTDAYGRK